ncbi:MAG: hypothetical protein ACI8TQ_001600 [Planctomycetota bacterium]|jgi:hypothetical protein
MQELPQLKDDLILEIDFLRERLAKLEKDLVRYDANNGKAWAEVNPREERKPFVGTFSFTGDFDEVEARGVDLSPGGVCFEIGGDLPFSLQMRQGAKIIERSGSLAWARRMAEGKCRFGFEFTDLAPEEGDDEILLDDHEDFVDDLY